MLRTEVFELIHYPPSTDTCASSRCCSSRRRSTASTCSTSRPGRSVVEHLVAAGQQVFLVLLVQSRRRAGAFRPRHLRARGAGGARRSRRDRAQPAVHINAACSGGIITAGALGHLAATAALVASRASRCGCARSTTNARDRGGAREPRARRGGGRGVGPQGLPRRARAGRRVRLAAPQRPDLELRRQQLPARQGPAGVRHPLLEPGLRAPGRGAAPRFRPPRARELAHASRAR